MCLKCPWLILPCVQLIIEAQPVLFMQCSLSLPVLLLPWRWADTRRLEDWAGFR